tara:strand:+ start:8880 stop:10175 length:1296 start_codon:yes stop_codon:yes gene_type:complete
MLKSNFKKQKEQGQQDVVNNEDDQESKILTASNSVGSSRAKKLANILILLLSCGVVFYFLLFQENPDDPNQDNTKDIKIELDKELEALPPEKDLNFEEVGDISPLEQTTNKELERPTLPALPELPVIPDLPEEKEIYPELEQKDSIKSGIDDLPTNSSKKNLSTDQQEKKDNNSKEYYSDPRRTPIMPENIQLPQGNSFGDQNGIRDLSGNAIQQPLAPTPPTVVQNKDLSSIIAQGKMMTAILETAINTEVPGDIRGIVNRDVYAESGNNILIPKGTRLFGSYSSNIARGQGRVEITWNRIIRPDGLDVSISLSASDQYGRSGISGEVDNQYSSTIANALLTSVLAVGGALAADALSGDNSSTTTGSDGSVISTDTASAQVITQVTGAVIDTVTKMIEDSINIQPVIRIPHGTKMTVIVNSDITLPPYEY